MTTSLTATFVLPADVMLIPVEQLAPAVREQVGGAAGDVAITRPRSRHGSRVVDANAAGLLQLFREPTTVVDAIVRFSRTAGADPRVVLESAFPLVERLVSGGILLPANDARAKPIVDAITRGDTLGAFTIVDRIQVLEDVELHRGSRADGVFAAIKVARPGFAEPLRTALAHEAAVLGRLDGGAAPRVLEAGLEEPLPFLALSWCAGVPPTRALEYYHDPKSQPRSAILGLCAYIAGAFADLHDRGVLHGDVHAGNVLVDADGTVSILDFGLAALRDEPSRDRPRRGGIAEYYDPQYAAWLRAGGHPPLLDERADQYSIAAMLYIVATGHPYLELSLRREEALRQIVEDEPLSFAARGAKPWPDFEAVLRRALSKDPGARFADVRGLADALATLDAPVDAPMLSRTADRRRFIDTLVTRLAPDGPLYAQGLPEPPYLSVNNGAAGIAYAFYRMAIARESAELLSHADAWIARGKSWTSEREAWYTDDGLVSKKEIGSLALYHTMTGIHCVETLIALNSGFDARAERCASDFVAASRARGPNLDLTLGKAGLVVGATLMLEASPNPWPKLRQRASTILDGIMKELSTLGPMANEPRLRYLGMAHGWSGLLWTIMRWHRANGTPQPDFIEPRLAELAALGTPRGRGRAWAWSTDARDIGLEPHPAPTWCNGAAGHIHTWLEAHELFSDDRYLDLALQAAWNVWDDSGDGLADACCGFVGRAYSLLAVWRRTGDQIWRRRAEMLADRALDASTPESGEAHRLYKGGLGVALLLEELENSPEEARMPLFESEGWHRGWT